MKFNDLVTLDREDFVYTLNELVSKNMPSQNRVNFYKRDVYNVGETVSILKNDENIDFIYVPNGEFLYQTNEVFKLHKKDPEIFQQYLSTQKAVSNQFKEQISEIDELSKQFPLLKDYGSENYYFQNFLENEEKYKDLACLLNIPNIQTYTFSSNKVSKEDFIKALESIPPLNIKAFTIIVFQNEHEGIEILNVVKYLKSNFSDDEVNTLLKIYINEDYDQLKYTFPLF